MRIYHPGKRNKAFSWEKTFLYVIHEDLFYVIWESENWDKKWKMFKIKKDWKEKSKNIYLFKIVNDRLIFLRGRHDDRTFSKVIDADRKFLQSKYENLLKGVYPEITPYQLLTDPHIWAREIGRQLLNNDPIL